MAKSRTEKIASYDEQIAALQKKRTEELDKQKQEEKDEREKRQRKRGEILEKLIPETVDLTVEQFTALLNKTTANPFGRDKLAEIIKESESKPKPKPHRRRNPHLHPRMKSPPHNRHQHNHHRATSQYHNIHNPHHTKNQTSPQMQMTAKIKPVQFRSTDFAIGKIQNPNRTAAAIPLPLYQRKRYCHVYDIGETDIIGGFTVSKHSKRITFCVLAGETPDPKT